jgi:hyaluronoglucosaminidase
VPQAGNLSAHIETLKASVARQIPDPEWDGNAVFDFEAWTPIWEQNQNSDNWHGKR